jgi:hypothetical protein
MKKILIFDPDWYFLEEVEVISILKNIEKPDAIIYYDQDINKLVKNIWNQEIECIYFLDILKNNVGSIEYQSKLTWRIARSMSLRLNSLNELFVHEEIKYFEVDELFLGSKLAIILRDVVIFNYIKNNFNSSHYTLTLISANNTYKEYIKNQAKINLYELSIIESYSQNDYKEKRELFPKISIKKWLALFQNTLRYLSYNITDKNKIGVYAFAHRDTIPVINHLSNNSKYEILVEGSDLNDSSYVIAPNLFKIFIIIRQKISSHFMVKHLERARHEFVITLNNIFQEELGDDFDFHEYYFNKLYDLIMTRYNLFRVQHSTYNSILKSVRPSRLLHCSYVSLEQRLLFKLSEKYNIKTYSIEHGLMNQLRLSSDIIYSDYLFVWGKASKRSYFELHPQKNKDKVIVAGVSNGYELKYTSIYGNQSGKQRFILVNLPHIKIIKSLSIHVESSFSPVASLAKGFYIFRAYQELFTALESESFHIQVHPNDDISLYKQLLSKHNNLSFSQGDSSENILKSKLLISTSSTLILDAIKVGIPSISFWPLSKELLTISLRYKNTGTVFHCFTVDEVIRIIEQNESGLLKIDSDKRRKYLHDIIECSGVEALNNIETAMFH